MNCKRCFGLGTVAVSPDGPDEYNYGKCPNCEGTGHIKDPEPSGPLLKVRRVGTHSLPLPAYARPGDAAIDLRTADAFTILPGQRATVPCGFAFELPPGHVGLIQGRSGLAREGIAILGGVVDPNYRGEVSIVLASHAHDFEDGHEFEAGDRVAQMLVLPIASVRVEEASELSASERGESGFGSSGTR